MSSRSRSLSPSRVYREGVNLYNPRPESHIEAVQIEDGRAKTIEELRSLTGASNTVTFMGEPASFNGRYDTFRVSSSTPGGLPASASAELMRRHPGRVNIGPSGNFCLVNVPQKKYDKRVLCFDLTRCQCVAVFMLLLTATALLFFAYDVHRFAIFNDNSSWLGRAVTSKGVVTSFEI